MLKRIILTVLGVLLLLNVMGQAGPTVVYST